MIEQQDGIHIRRESIQRETSAGELGPDRPPLSDAELAELLALAARGADGKAAVAERLAGRYPRTIAAFRAFPSHEYSHHPSPVATHCRSAPEAAREGQGVRVTLEECGPACQTWAGSGLDHLAYVLGLEQRWRAVARGQVAPDVIRDVPTRAELPQATEEYDLVYAGGVLGLFSAAVMARRGYRVLCFDQRQVGTSHREWNISADELYPLSPSSSRL